MLSSGELKGFEGNGTVGWSAAARGLGECIDVCVCPTAHIQLWRSHTYHFSQNRMKF